MKKIIQLLSALEGVKTVSQITKVEKEKIAVLERGYENSGVVGLKNIGIRMVLQSNFVFAILKDASFRPPPGPTVLMVEDHNKDDKQTDHLRTIGSKDYRVIGEEIIDKQLPEVKEEYIYISDDFILYPERRKEDPKRKAYFLVPPINFLELEDVKDFFKIENIISVSPSTIADDYIRKRYSFSKSDQLATILVGFNKTP